MSLHTATKIPAITQIKGLPPLAVMALQAIKETLEVREGLHEPLDAFVSIRDLADLILNDEDIIDYLGSGHSHDDRYYTKTQWNLAAKGDLNIAQAAGVPGTLPVGTDNKLIRADSGATLGIEYFSLLGTSNQLTVTHNASDTTLSLPQDIHTGASPTFASLTLSTIPAGTADYDKFIVSDGGVLKYRTGAEVLSDIGAGAGGVSVAFKTITGITNDVVADLAEDTLTLATGNALLSILGDAGADSITFTVNEGTLDHGSIAGLGDSADHAWALLVDGSRSLTASWFASAAITLANDTSFQVRDTGANSRNLATIDSYDQIIYGDVNLNSLYLRSSQNLYFQRWDGGVRTLLQLNTLGAKLENGTEINEFSIDGTLAGDSDDAVPTEQAVKTYVDNTGFKSKARGYRATSQTIPQTTWTRVQLDNESFDELGEFDPVTNYRFTASQPGYYMVFGQVSSAYVVPDGARYVTRIYKNGANEISSDKSMGSAQFTAQSVSGIVYLAATEYLELWFYHTDASNNIVNGSGDTFMTVHRLS